MRVWVLAGMDAYHFEAATLYSHDALPVTHVRYEVAVAHLSSGLGSGSGVGAAVRDGFGFGLVRVRVSLECLSPSCTKWLGKALTLTLTITIIRPNDHPHPQPNLHEVVDAEVGDAQGAPRLPAQLELPCLERLPQLIHCLFRVSAQVQG